MGTEFRFGARCKIFIFSCQLLARLDYRTSSCVCLFVNNFKLGACDKVSSTDEKVNLNTSPLHSKAILRIRLAIGGQADASEQITKVLSSNTAESLSTNSRAYPSHFESVPRILFGGSRVTQCVPRTSKA
jgi:hypothetical protein